MVQIWRQSAAFHKGLELPSQIGANCATLDRLSSRPFISAALPVSQPRMLGQTDDRISNRARALVSSPEPTATLEREGPDPPREGPPARPNRRESCQPAGQVRRANLPSVDSADFLPLRAVAPAANPVRPIGQSTPIDENIPQSESRCFSSPPPLYNASMSKEYAAWNISPRNDSLESEVEGEMVAHIVVQDWKSEEVGHLKVSVGDEVVVM